MGISVLNLDSRVVKVNQPKKVINFYWGVSCKAQAFVGPNNSKQKMYKEKRKVGLTNNNNKLN